MFRFRYFIFSFDSHPVNDIWTDVVDLNFILIIDLIPEVLSYVNDFPNTGNLERVYLN